MHLPASRTTALLAVTTTAVAAAAAALHRHRIAAQAAAPASSARSHVRIVPDWTMAGAAGESLEPFEALAEADAGLDADPVSQDTPRR